MYQGISQRKNSHNRSNLLQFSHTAHEDDDHYKIIQLQAIKTLCDKLHFFNTLV